MQQTCKSDYFIGYKVIHKIRSVFTMGPNLKTIFNLVLLKIQENRLKRLFYWIFQCIYVIFHMFFERIVSYLNITNTNDDMSYFRDKTNMYPLKIKQTITIEIRHFFIENNIFKVTFMFNNGKITK